MFGEIKNIEDELTDLNRNLYLREFRHVNRDKSSFVYVKTNPWADCK